MASRCILVLGIPRSGTSCVAGVLHKIGVNMGAGHFQSKDKFNSRGYYEDLQWRHANQRLTGKGYSLKGAHIETIGKQQRRIYRQLAKQYKAKALWGIKDPWLCFLARFIWPILKNQGIDVRIVATHRDIAASTASVARHLKKSYKRSGERAEKVIRTWKRGMVKQLVVWGTPIFHIDYERLVANPLIHTRRLADFCFDGLDITPSGMVEAAAWVTPSLKHF